ncbi:MAG TPA: DUF4424 domain-containing protein [Sphingomicrobium sp.]
MRHILLTAAALGIASAALANDTTASTGAGGLVIERTDAIALASEDLFVSADEIRVHYVFRNRTARDVETVVAFPMPDRDLSAEYGGDVGYPSGFETRVAGRRVTATLERKAVVKGKDHSALLRRLGVPLAPDSINDATRAMDRLSPAQRKQLVAAGLAGDEEYDDTGKGMKHHLIPLWTVKDKYWWPQRFPAGRDLVVDHRYAPGVGGSVESSLAFKSMRGTAEFRQMAALYCADEAFIAAVDRLARKDQTEGPGMPDKWIDYILTTGANWASPIGSFRLVVDKGKPGNLLSFCEDGVKKIGPTQFEVRRSNWRPTRDLHVLIIEPRR